MHEQYHVPSESLEAGMPSVLESPKVSGVLHLIVCRPEREQREVLREGRLNELTGLIGDNWLQRGSSSMPDRRANPDAQITLMNSRAAALVAQTTERWALAGDQLYADFDMSVANLPAGSRLLIGDAIIEITAEPHTGCSKFKTRFGAAALAWVNSPTGLAQRLRGVNAHVVRGGVIRVGDSIVKL